MDLQKLLDHLPEGWLSVGVALLMLLLLVAWMRAPRRGPARLTGQELALHEIRSTLGCTSQQARLLLDMYHGSSAKAIMEVKTGRAVLPDPQQTELPASAGELRFLQAEDDLLILVDRHDRAHRIPWSQQGYFSLALLDSEKRPDARGFCDANRGRLYGHLYLLRDGRWVRFLVDGGRMDYATLGERMQNTASRNLRVLLQNVAARASDLEFDDSARAFLEELRARPYASAADFERQSLARFSQLYPAQSD
ncbi:MAG: hypothetical protein HY319_24860 [Armatimonadetes bacterium]|nr:hypothetical protein [Armatimonadota bacterium]